MQVSGSLPSLPAAVVVAWPFAAALLAAPLMAQDPAPVGLAAAALVHEEFRWLPREVPGFRVYFATGTYAARHQDSLLARLPEALHHAERLIAAEPLSDPIDLFFVESREQMAALIGTRATGFAHAAARAVFLVTNPAWRGFERHEVMHVVAVQAWGRPAANTEWLQEGLAQAADGHCGPYDNATVLRGLVQQRGWIPWADVVLRFREQQDLRAYLQAAAFVDHLLSVFGPEAIQPLWAGGVTLESSVGAIPLAEVERQFRARIDALSAPPASALRIIEEKGCG